MTRCLLLPLALLAFAGCAKVEVAEAPDVKVTFTVGSYASQTKAASILGETTTFRSKGFLHAKGVSQMQDFFGTNGETITWDSTEKEWAPSHVYYWPKSSESYVNFVSWYDKNEATVAAAQKAAVTETTSETTTVTSLSWSGRKITADDNIMWADEAWRYNQNAETYKFDGVKEGIPTLFHHALAKLVFKAYATPDIGTTPNTWWKVKITEITLSGLKDTGTLSLTNSDKGSTGTKAWTTDGWTSLTTSTGTGAGTLTGTLDELPTSVSTAENDPAIITGLKSTVIPQDVTAMTVTIKYEISTYYADPSSNSAPTAYSVEKLSATNVPLYSTTEGAGFSQTIDAWEMNKIYTYIIKIDPSTKVITFLPDAQDWTSVVGSISIE